MMAIKLEETLYKMTKLLCKCPTHGLTDKALITINPKNKLRRSCSKSVYFGFGLSRLLVFLCTKIESY